LSAWGIQSSLLYYFYVENEGADNYFNKYTYEIAFFEEKESICVWQEKSRAEYRYLPEISISLLTGAVRQITINAEP